MAGALSSCISEHYTATEAFCLSAPRDPLERDEFRTALKTPPLRLDQASIDALREGRKRAFRLRLREGGPHLTAPLCEISVSHTDKRKATEVAFQLLTALSRRNMSDHYYAHEDEPLHSFRLSGLGEQIVGAPQSFSPKLPMTHCRLVLTFAGAVPGILLAIFRRPPYLTSMNGESSLSL